MQPQNTHDDRETIRALEVLSASAEPPPRLHGANPAALGATGERTQAHPSPTPDQLPSPPAHPARARNTATQEELRAVGGLAPPPGRDTRIVLDGRPGPNAGGTPDVSTARAASAPDADSGASGRGLAPPNAADGGSPRALADARALAALAVTHTRPPVRSTAPPVGPVRPAPAKQASSSVPPGGSRSGPPPLAGGGPAGPPTSHGRAAPPVAPARPNAVTGAPLAADPSGPATRLPPHPAESPRAEPATMRTGSHSAAPTTEGTTGAASPPTAGAAAGATVVLPADKFAATGGVAPPRVAEAPPAVSPRSRGRPAATSSSELRGAPYRCLRCGYPLLPESGWRCSECGAAHQESTLRHWYSADERLRASRLQWICGAVLLAHVCTLPSAVGVLQAGIFDLLRIGGLVLAGWGAWEAGRKRLSSSAGTWAIGGMLCSAVTAWWTLASGRGGWDAQMGVALGEMTAAWLLLGAVASPTEGVAHWGSVRGRRIAMIGLCITPLLLVAVSTVGALLGSPANFGQAALAFSGQPAAWGGGTGLGPVAILLLAGLPAVLQLAVRGFVWLWIAALARALYGGRGR